MKLGDRVRTRVSLSGIPAGAVGSVREIGRVFVAVEFPDARLGYYASRQLEAAAAYPLAGEYASAGFGGESIRYGDHLCVLPSSTRDLLESAARYLAAGLKEGDTCITILPDEFTAPLDEIMTDIGLDVAEAVASRRLIAMRCLEVYLEPGQFTAERQLARLGRAVASAVPVGAGKMRAFGSPQTVLFDLPAWWDYEGRATAVLRDSGVLGMCGYQADGWRTDQWARAEAVHPYVVKAGEVVLGGASVA